MKKFFALLTAAAMLIFSASGCATFENEKIKVVCTTFAAYDWTLNIAGSENPDVETVLLCDSSADMHSYQATADDMIELSMCDILIYTGGQSEKWVSDGVSSNDKAVIINLIDILGEKAKIQQHEDTNAHEHDEDEYDEHVWLSLKNAVLFCDEIARALSAADPENSQLYSDNAQDYTRKLTDLDAEYREAVDSAENDTLIFADRFPFVYLMEDYGINYFAAFEGCSAETEASFDTVLFLAEKVDELNIGCLMTVDGSQSQIAQAVAQNTHDPDMPVLSLDSMQTGTEQGKTYLSVMESNLDIIKKALDQRS